MRLDVKFRLSVYLSLVLASACLGQAEEPFLPGVFIFIAAVGLVFALAFALEGRWALTIVWANLLGMVIAAGAAFWIFFHMVKPPGGLGSVAPWPALLLPYIGPVLMCLLLAKLFRPKQVNDFWLLHTVGLMEVILACVLASDPLFGLLLFGYVVCSLWSLSLFYVYRERLRAGAESHAGAPIALRPLRRAFGWSVLAGLVALALFLLTPPLGESAWSPFLLNRGGPIVQGFTDQMDLNRTGHVQPSDEVAFTVRARDAKGDPFLELSGEQRWRGAVLDHYERGRWVSRSLTLLRKSRDDTWRFPGHRPEPRPGQIALDFAVPEATTTNALFLADPLWLPDDTILLPIASLQPDQRRSWYYQIVDQTLVPMPIAPPSGYHYEQLTFPPREPGVGPALSHDPREDELYYQQPVPGIRLVAADVIQQLQQAGTLDDADASVTGDNVQVEPAKWEKVAHALTEHLRSSHEYAYTLQLRRRDITLDPNEDFLRNIKQGHCERFASALALLLRSCRIPTRVVMGFRGAESQEPGEYLVRQNFAHSWVEVAVSRNDPHGTPHWHWLTLDPTPSDDAQDQAGDNKLHGWGGWKQLGESMWRNFVVDYNAEKRSEATTALVRRLGLDRLWRGVVNAATTIGALGGASIAVGIALLWLLARYRGRRRPPATSPKKPPVTFGSELYARLLGILERRLKLSPRPSQTPLEFARLAESALAGRELAPALAETPERVVGLLYRVHFGRRPSTPDETQELDRRLGELEAALTVPPGD
jgi:hypothetical protein